MAEITTKSTSTSRTILSDVIPLKTPFIVQFFPIYGCNFKCKFCIHSIPENKRGYVADKKVMDFELYKKAIDDLKEFDGKIKMIRFAATGEPLLHSKIADMVAYAKEKNVANSVEIVTNASLLNKELSDKLINANLDWLRISIEGLTSEKYKEICGADIDFDDLVKNIEYFYKNKKNAKVYIKIIDCALDKGEEEKFFDIFGSICDKIAIEKLLPAVDDIDYSKISDNDFSKSQNGNELFDIEVCPQPFYLLQVNPDGNIAPCCSMETPITLGNIQNKSIKEIWQGPCYKNFQLMLLKDKSKNPICAKCQTYKFGTFKEDILDYKKDEIIRRISE